MEDLNLNPPPCMSFFLILKKYFEKNVKPISETPLKTGFFRFSGEPLTGSGFFSLKPS